MTKIVGVRFRNAGKIYYFDPDQKDYSLGELVIEGIETNLDFQYEILNHDAFGQGDTDTHFIPTYFPQYGK